MPLRADAKLRPAASSAAPPTGRSRPDCAFIHVFVLRIAAGLPHRLGVGLAARERRRTGFETARTRAGSPHAPARDGAPGLGSSRRSALARKEAIVRARVISVVGARRRGGRLALASVSVALLGFSGAAQASTSWSAPVSIDNGHGLTGVTCVSTSRCIAVDKTGAVTFDPTSPGTQVVAPVGLALVSVACPAKDQCTAVELSGQEITFNPAPPRVTTAYNGPRYPYGVACPSATQCTVVGQQGGAGSQPGVQYTFNPISSATLSTTSMQIGNDVLESVACPSGSECVAVDSHGNEFTFDPTAPGTPSAVNIDGTGWLTAVACPSASQCTALDRAGRIVTFDPSSPGATTAAVIAGRDVPTALACPSVSGCVAVDGAGRAITFDPMAPRRADATTIDAEGALTAVACASARLCVAVDSAGRELTWTGGDGRAVAGPRERGRHATLRPPAVRETARLQ